MDFQPIVFTCVLELYNSDTSTFFMPFGELDLALHEMYEVSVLPIGEILYEEYVPTGEELHLLKLQNPLIYDTYGELLCHYQICAQVTGLRNNGVKQKAWANYLFLNFDSDTPYFSYLPFIFDKEVEEKITQFRTHSYVTDSDEDVFKAGTSFVSFHYQAKHRLSNSALLTGFLMLCLKRCVVTTTPKEALSVGVVYPAILFAHRHPLSLLQAMICDMQNGLRVLIEKFYKVKTVHIKHGSEKHKTPNPLIELPHTYLMAWLSFIAPH